MVAKIQIYVMIPERESNSNLEEPEGDKWDEVERRRTLFKRERSKSVVFTAEEPEETSDGYCGDVDGDSDGEHGDVDGDNDGEHDDVDCEDNVDNDEDDKEPSHLSTRDELLLLGSAPEDDGEQKESEGQVHLLKRNFRGVINTDSHAFI